jgi:hypothetical protein
LRDEITIADLVKNARERLRVTFRDFKMGGRGIDLRVFVQNGQRVPMPTANGLSLKPKLIRPMIDALRKAEKQAVREGLIEPE